MVLLPEISPPVSKTDLSFIVYCAGEARSFVFERAFVTMISNDVELRDMLLSQWELLGGGGGYSKGARQSLRGDFKGAGGFVSVMVGRRVVVCVHSHKRV
jgi:hypothetical protein